MQLTTAYRSNPYHCGAVRDPSEGLTMAYRFDHQPCSDGWIMRTFPTMFPTEAKPMASFEFQVTFGLTLFGQMRGM